MSDQNQIASRYANAFFALIQEAKSSDSIEKELLALLELIKTNDDFRNFLSNPIVKLTEQKDVISELVGKTKMGDLTHNLLQLLCQNRRLSLLAVVIEDVLVRLEEARGELRARVTSAKELSGKQEKTIIDMLAKKTGKKVNIHVSIDKELIGGLVVQYGSIMIDDSVKSKLEKLKRQMKGAA